MEILSQQSAVEKTPSVFGRKDYRLLGFCLFLVFLVWFVFGQTIGYGFVNCDDDVFVYQNPLILQGLQPDKVFRAVTSISDTFYYPLTLISFMTDAEVYGMNPSGFHLTNVFLHMLSVLLLFFFLKRLTGTFWESGLVAVLFAIHPLQVEAVTWVTARKDVLSGLFFMLSLHAYLSYVRNPFSLIRYSLIFVLFLCGLMAKPMLVTIPAVFLLLDWWPLKRFRAQPRLVVLEKIPLLILSGIFSLIPFIAKMSVKSGTPVVQPSFWWRLGNGIVSYAVYVRQMFFPYGLGMPYPKYELRGWMLLISLTLLATVSVAVFYFRKKRPVLLFGWLWYLGMLFPVAGVLRFLGVARADRFVYLPSIGLFILITWSVFQFSFLRKYLKAGACIFIIWLVLTAHFQVRHWRNNITLWTHALNVAGESTMAYINLGAALFEERELSAAETCFQRVLQLDPGDQEALYNLGLLRVLSNRPDEGEKYLLRVLELNPNRFDANKTLGAAYISQGRIEKGMEYTIKALQIRPNDAATLANLEAAKEIRTEMNKKSPEEHPPGIR